MASTWFLYFEMFCRMVDILKEIIFLLQLDEKHITIYSLFLQNFQKDKYYFL